MAIFYVLLSIVVILITGLLLKIWVNSKSVELGSRVKEWKEQGNIFTWKPQDTELSCDIFYRDSDSSPQGGNKEDFHLDKPILLMLHGFPTSSWDWNIIWPSLVEKPWRVIAPDLLGYGFSDKPATRKIYRNSIVFQADMVEDLLTELTGTVRTSVFILSHDYGDSIAQELLHRSIHSSRENASRIMVESVCFLNGGLIPGIHQPTFIQKVLESPLGFMVTLLSSRDLFGKRFSAVFGKKPTETELDEYWSIIKYNSGYKIQHYLIQYMGERVRNKKVWVDALRNPDVPLCLIDGPCDPVSGQHLAEAVADIWEVEPTPSDRLEKGKQSVIMLPAQCGHYPQIECPDLLLKHFYSFMEANFGPEVYQMVN